MPKTISHGMDGLQTHTNPACQPFNLANDGYLSSNSSLLSSKESLFLHIEAESSDTVAMLVMITEAANIEEQLVSMKAILNKLLQESAERDAQIKRQNKQITDLTKKLEKRPIETSNKCSDAEDSDDEFSYNEKLDNERKAKKDRSLGSTTLDVLLAYRS